MAEMAVRWAGRWRIIAADPGRYLPGWAAAETAGLRSREPAPPGLPNLPVFCTDQARRLLHTAKRRLSSAGRG